MNQSFFKKWLKTHQQHLLYVTIIAAAFILYGILAYFTSIDDFVIKIWNSCVPFIYGAIIAYILRPCCNLLCRALEKIPCMKKRESLANIIAVVLSLLLGVGVLCLIGVAIIPGLVDSIVSIVKTLPETMNALVISMEEFVADKPKIQEYIQAIYDYAKNTFNSSILPGLSEMTSSIGNGAISVFGFISDIFIGIVASVYLLADRRNLKRRLCTFIQQIPNQKTASFILDELKFTDRTFSKYMTGTIIDALIVGVAMYVFCIATNIPSPLLISTICAITNIIPIIGPFLGAIPSAFIVLAYTPDKFVMFCVFVLILQQIDGHILVPKVLGEAVGISGLLALFAITIGGELFGAIGMIFGVPVLTVIIDVFEKLIKIKQKQSEPEGGQ